jgi:hypothetical protein
MESWDDAVPDPFDDAATIFPEEELPDLAKAAQVVVQEAKDAGLWVEGQRATP